MFNNNENTNSSRDEKLDKNLKILIGMTIILGISRIISLEIMAIISDLLTAVMIYFYMIQKNKCMAIFLAINGGIGIIYAVFKFFPAYSALKGNWFSFYYFVLFIIATYSLIVYGLICYAAYDGIQKYEMAGFGLPLPGNYNSQSQNTGVSTNYGALESQNPETNTGFKAFSGKGVALG
jgi:hypothetical protein